MKLTLLLQFFWKIISKSFEHPHTVTSPLNYSTSTSTQVGGAGIQLHVKEEVVHSTHVKDKYPHFLPQTNPDGDTEQICPRGQ